MAPEAGAAPAGAGPRRDRIDLPPELRQFDAPNGAYRLALSTADHWRSRQATARLLRWQSGHWQAVWQQVLPHMHGPRRVLVTGDGAVVLVDEWINVASRHALMLLAPDGQILADLPFDTLVARLGVTRREVADHGRLGIWLSAEPVLSADGREAVLAAAGKQLHLRLADGELTVVD